MLVELYGLSRINEIVNTLEAKQHIVCGCIEYVYLPNDNNVVLICSKE
ncbi:MAG: hypothetical protein ACI4WW_01265 [Candidatus Coprovivens sp.]